MKKTVPFSKEIPFKTRIAEITDIEVTHNLIKTPDNTIEGNFLVDGSYKMTDASQIEEKFSHELPFIIDVDSKYDLENVKIKISDFFFEIINEDILRVNIEIALDDIEEKQLVEARCYDDEDEEEIEFDDIEPDNIPQPIDILDVEIPKALEVERPTVKTQTEINITNTTSISDIFTYINQDEDNFMTYYVHIVRDNDTLDDILTKYSVTRDDISEYNDLDNIKIGTKLIIPCVNNE